MIYTLLRIPLTLALSLLWLAWLAQPAASQPRIASIMPDIGTPGMSTYVELIAPQSATNTFPFSGLLGSSTIVVEPALASDSSRIVVSPVVVSWDGRMIGCHVFVRPGSAIGTVTLRARWGTTTTNSVDFAIVMPESFGEKTGGGVIGSGGGWGTRSPRGAMIVDSMVLRSGSYTVSTADPDATAGGNQGFLPAVILSRGRIVVASDATLRVDATGKHGGPGGGGGGGYGPTRPQIGFIPAIPGERDAPQGDGFTGGRSAVPIVPSPGPFGAGTGADSKSINGVETNTAFRTGATSLRLYGSGPGHPFDSDGRSGGAAAIAAGAPPAIFGTRFGGGGNATNGSGITDLTDLNGQAVGNRQIVPLHGGAGGAGGGSNDSIGGGGGGAIALYAGTSASIALASSRGAAGRNGCASCGTGSGDPSGGGAGGGLIIGARGRLDIGTIDVAGGAGGTAPAGSSIAGSGGVGRMRHDGRTVGAPSVTAGSSRFVGPTLDTLSYVDSLYRTISGTGRPGDSISVFIRGDAAPWPACIGTTVGSDSSWRMRARFPTDTIAFVVALQKTPSAELSTAAYSYTPTHIFSQSAASIVRVYLFSRIVAPTRRSIDSVICPQFRFDTLVVRNSGTAPLIIGTGTAFVGTNAGLFAIISPTLPDTVAPGDSIRIVVRFDGRTARNGKLGATLRLVTNDRLAPRHDIALDVVKEDRTFELTPLAFDLGELSVGAIRDTRARYRNANSYPDTITSIVPISGATGVIRVIGPGVPSIQAAGTTRDLTFRFAPTDTGRFVARYRITTLPCGRDTTITVTGYARSAIIGSRTDLDFAGLGCSDSASERLVVRNTGNAVMILNYPTLTGAEADSFAIDSPPSASFPRTVAIGDSVVFVLRARNASTTNPSASLTFRSNDSLAGKDPWIVRLDGSRDPVTFTPVDTVVDFGTICAGDAVTRAISIGNHAARSSLSITSIDRSSFAAPFQQLPQLPLPTLIGARDSVSMIYVFSPGAAGFFTDTLTVRLSPCDRLARIILRGTAVERTASFSRAALDFADVRLGDRAIDTVIISNARAAGTPPIEITSIALAASSAGLTIAWPPLPATRTLAAGDSMHVLVAFSPTTGGPIAGDSLVVSAVGLCATRTAIRIDGRGVTSSVVATRSRLTFRSGPCTPPGSIDDTLSLINRGSAPLSVTSIMASPSGTFMVVDPLTSFVLSPQQSRTIRVRYTPGRASALTVSGTLTIISTDLDRPTLTVDLQGRRDSSAIAIDDALLDFGTRLACQSALELPVTLRNEGTLVDTIGVASMAGIVVVPAGPYRLAPGADTTLIVRFDAVVPGDYSGTLAFVGALCAGRRTSNVRGRVEGIALSLRGPDFGEVAVGSIARADAFIDNPHAMTMRVVSARVVGTGGDVSIVPGQLPMLVAAGGRAPLALEYRPSVAGDIPSTAIELDIDSVCAIRMSAPVVGRGITGGVAVSRRDIDFGSNLLCVSAIDSVVIRNVGSAPIDVTSMSLTESPPSSFAIVSGPAVPVTLDPSDSLVIVLRFAPLAGADGARAGRLLLGTNDPQRPDIAVDLRGARTSESLTITGGSFPRVPPGGRITRRVVLVNTGTAPVVIGGFDIGAPFEVLGSDPRTPVTLQPGDTIGIDIEFAPIESGSARDTLRVIGAFGCLHSSMHPIEAGSLIASATLSIPDFEAAPGERLTIPIEILGSTGLDDADATDFIAYIRFNRTLLLPATTPLGSVVGNDRIVALACRRAPGQIDGPVATFAAIAALGDTLATAIVIDSVRWNSANVDMTLRAGSVRIRPSGGWRLFVTTGLMGLATRPNPATESVIIEYETIEPGTTRIDLIDALGRLVSTLFDAETTPGAYALVLETQGLAAGTYFLRLETPGAVRSHPMQIVH